VAAADVAAGAVAASVEDEVEGEADEADPQAESIRAAVSRMKDRTSKVVLVFFIILSSVMMKSF
jgi:hypothetical protein